MSGELGQERDPLRRAKEFDYYKEIYPVEYERKWGKEPILVRGDVFLESLKFLLRSVHGVELQHIELAGSP